MNKNLQFLLGFRFNLFLVLALLLTTKMLNAQSVSIAASANPICSGTFVTFSATPIGAPTPEFAWYLNGAFTGQSGSTYSNPSLSNGNNVVCYMFYGGFNYASNTIIMTVGSVQTYYLDADGDGFGAGSAVSACSPPSSNYVTNNLDCNDSNFNIKPTATEIRCNGIDENCNGMADDTGPEISVTGIGQTIANGSTSVSTLNNTDFGNVSIGSPVDKTFQITNTGSSVLTISNISATNNSEFNANLFGFTFPINVSVSSTLNFTVRFTPNAAGTRTTTLNISSNDCDENPYNFILSGNSICSSGPNASVTPSSGTLTCSTTSINLVASGGNTYLWDDNSTNASRTITAGGNYSVTVTGSNGCTATASSSINTNTTAPSASVTPSSGTLTCSTTSINLVASGGDTYLWDDNSTNASRTITAGGNYSVTVTGSNGCTATASSTINTNTTTPSASVTPSSGTLTCSTTSINLVASGGGTYAWSNGSTLDNITVTSGGNYSVTVTGANGCTSVASANISSNTTAPTASVTPSSGTLTCSTTSINLVASGGGTYAWSNGSTLDNITVTSGGNYSVTVTGSNGCTSVASASISSNTTAPTASVTPSSGTLTCSTTSINLVASGGGTYAWSNGSTSDNITVTSGGNYSVTVTGANGCTAVASASISSNTTAPSTTINAPSTSCVNSQINLSVPNAGVGASYTWTGGNGIINANSSSTTATPTTNGSISYGVQIVAANGCSASSIITINVSNTATWYQDFDGDGFGNPSVTQSNCIQPTGYVSNNTDCNDNDFNANTLPNASNISAQSNTTFCVGGSVILTGNTSGVWNTGSTLSSITVNQSGTYTVTTSNSCGSVTSNSILVTINPLPTPANLSAQSNTTFCAGGSVVLTGNNGGVWNTGSTLSSITVSQSGTYSVTTSNSCGSVTSNAIVITVNSNPTPTILGSENFCPSNTATLSTSQNYNVYLWSNGSSSSSTIITQANTYSVTVIDANNCSGSGSVTVFPCGVAPQGSFPITQCGYLTNVINGNILCNVTPGASGYLAKFYNVGSNIVYAQKTVSTNSITFTGLIPALVNSTQYDVTVTPIMPIGPQGIESAKCRMGLLATQDPNSIAECSLSTPACVVNPANAPVLTNSATIKCSAVTQASTFQFRFENIANSSEVILAYQSGVRTRTLAPLNLTPGATYAVSVRATVTGIQAANFGPVCYIKMAGLTKENSIANISVSNNKFDVSVYPNPLVNNTTIYVSDNTSSSANLVITDITGKVVYINKIEVNTNIELPTYNLESGIYFFTINTINGSRKIIKVAKQ